MEPFRGIATARQKQSLLAMTFLHERLCKYLSILFSQQISYVLDHEGWAVGVAVLWGYLPKW